VTESPYLYFVGQLITLERGAIQETLCQLSLSDPTHGDYLLRDCIHQENAKLLRQLMKHIIYQVHQFQTTHYGTVYGSILQRMGLQEHWDLLNQQYHLLRVLCLWLSTVISLQTIPLIQQTAGSIDCLHCGQSTPATCSTCRTQVDVVDILRQRIVDDLETLVQIVRVHLTPCVDATTYGVALNRIVRGARIESCLCRGERWEQQNRLAIAVSFYHRAMTAYQWTAPPRVITLRNRMSMNDVIVDEMELDGMEPSPRIRMEVYTVGAEEEAKWAAKRSGGLSWLLPSRRKI
jgi:ribosomal protein S26